MKRSEERLEAHRWLDRAAPQAMLDRYLTVSQITRWRVSLDECQ